MSKLCECGCGLEVKINRSTKQYSRFRSGHFSRTIEGKEVRKRIDQKRALEIKNKKNFEIPVLCKCGCGLKVKFGNVFIHGHSRRGKTNSPEMVEKWKKTLLEKTGFEFPSQAPEAKKKSIKTSQDNWGYDNPSQSPEVQKLQMIAFQKSLGTDWPSQSKEVRAKTAATNEERFGGPAPSCSEIILDKIKTSWRNKTPEEFKLIKEKVIKTNKNLRNCDNVMQDPIVKEKHQQTNIERRGVPWVMQDPNIILKRNQTCVDRYGVDNYSKTSGFRQLARRLLKESILKNYPDGAEWRPRKGNYEKEVFDELQKHCEFVILDDQTFIELYPDRYILELNIILELYEPWHKYKWAKKHDPIRQKELEDYLGCKFFIIWLDDWKNDKEKVISEFKNLLSQLSEQIKN